MAQRSRNPRVVVPASVFEVINGTMQQTELPITGNAKHHLQSHRDNGTPHSRLYLLQGLRPHWVKVFEDYFGINATFLESHMRRRPYQHHSWTRPVQSGAFSVSYPEIVRWMPPISVVGGNSAASPGDQNQSHMKVDALFDPAKSPLKGLAYGKYKDVGALLNHAASWNRIHRNKNIDFLLLLDDEVWTAESSGISKDFHGDDDQGQTTSSDDGDFRYPCGSLEILSCSLEVLICQTLQVAQKLPKDMYELNKYLHEIAVAKWEAYLDIYSASLRRFTRGSPRSSGGRRGIVIPGASGADPDIVITGASGAGSDIVIPASSGAGCDFASDLRTQHTKVCEEALEHIEWNMRVEALNSIIMDKDPMAKNFRIDNWNRLQRNCDAAAKRIESANKGQPESLVTLSSRSNVEEAISKQEADDAKQSLNRLAYLGGIFLPFSIVAAIFSMGQQFAAGMPLFYVYWVISLPLSLGVIITIYADTIRRLTPSQLAMKKSAETDAFVHEISVDYRMGSHTNNDRPLGWLGAYATVFRGVAGYR